MGPILSLRNRLRALLGRLAMLRQPIIFDFTTGEATRVSGNRTQDLAGAMKDALKKVTQKKVVRRVEGIPPHVVTQPKT
jgi:hypothetical protein